MSNESRRVVQKLHGVYNRTAFFLRLPRLVFLVAAVTAISATGADLKSETVQQWEDYVV